MPRLQMLAVIALFAPCGAGCIKTVDVLTLGAADAAGDSDAGGPPDASSTDCQPCLVSVDCGPAGACVQYAADDHCGLLCATDSDCAGDETCAAATSFQGKEVLVCLPRNGSCREGTGCGSCAAGTVCDVTLGACVASSPMLVADGGMCGKLAPPELASCCHACSPSSTCHLKPNGCYGGYWCDTSATPSCDCRRAPTSCGETADGGVVPASDAGAPTGTVNANGGTVSRLFFAVVGDTRPANLDDTDNYPTAVINDVFGLVATLKPQFVLATGDYMFASPSGIEGAEQVGLYQGVVARQLPGGLLFPVMGNQECAGPTASNCAGAPTANTTAYLDTLVKPLGKALPYYALAFDGSDGSWNAKLLVVACNAWDSDQAAWLQQQLASPTTFTLVARHEPSGADAPCVDATDRLLAQTDYDILFVGHAHTFGRSGKTLVVGNGGAPLTGAASFGFATVDQRGSRFLVTQYDSETKAPVAAFFMP